MLSNKKMSILVLVIVVFTITFSFISLRSQGQDDPNRTNQNKRDWSKWKEHRAKYESQFPVANYDAPELENLQEREKRKKKNNRYDNSRLSVIKNPDIDSSEIELVDERPLPLAIPTAESELAVIGEIINAEAYLSNNKAGIYSEFTIRVDEVLKNDVSNKLTQGSSITVDRPGGFVKYPNGPKVLYSVSGKGMPHTGNRYVLFLTKPDQSLNYYILTGYELKENKVNPLDNASRFEHFKGMSETDFIKTIRETLTPSASKYR